MSTRAIFSIERNGILRSPEPRHFTKRETITFIALGAITTAVGILLVYAGLDHAFAINTIRGQVAAIFTGTALIGMGSMSALAVIPQTKSLLSLNHLEKRLQAFIETDKLHLRETETLKKALAETKLIQNPVNQIELLLKLVNSARLLSFPTQEFINDIMKLAKKIKKEDVYCEVGINLLALQSFEKAQEILSLMKDPEMRLRLLVEMYREKMEHACSLAIKAECLQNVIVIQKEPKVFSRLCRLDQLFRTIERSGISWDEFFPLFQGVESHCGLSIQDAESIQDSLRKRKGYVQLFKAFFLFQKDPQEIISKVESDAHLSLPEKLLVFYEIQIYMQNDQNLCDKIGGLNRQIDLNDLNTKLDFFKSLLECENKKCCDSILKLAQSLLLDIFPQVDNSLQRLGLLLQTAVKVGSNHPTILEGIQGLLKDTKIIQSAEILHLFQAFDLLSHSDAYSAANFLDAVETRVDKSRDF